MKGRTVILIVGGLALAAVLTTLAGCGCSTGGDGDQSVDVSMGGQVVKADYLSFKPVSLAGTTLVIENTASDGTLEIGAGTPILDGGGSEVVSVRSAVSIDAGEQGALYLSGPLTGGLTYYLGEPQDGGKPTIRQLFIAPTGGGGGSGGFDIPTVEEPDIGE